MVIAVQHLYSEGWGLDADSFVTSLGVVICMYESSNLFILCFFTFSYCYAEPCDSYQKQISFFISGQKYFL